MIFPHPTEHKDLNPTSKSGSAGIWAQLQEVEGSMDKFLELSLLQF